MTTDQLTAEQQALIGRLYDAALDDTLWRALCNDMASAFGEACDVVIILEQQHRARLVCASPHFNDASLRAYEAYYYQLDIWTKWARKLGIGQIHSSAEHIHPRELERTEFYADFCRPNDLYHVIGGVLPLDAGETALLGVHRQRAQGAFKNGPQLKHQLQAFTAHLQRALQISSRLAHGNMAEHSARAALDCLDTAVLLIDARLEVVYANACAQTLFAPDLERDLHSHVADGEDGPSHPRRHAGYASFLASPIGSAKPAAGAHAGTGPVPDRGAIQGGQRPILPAALRHRAGARPRQATGQHGRPATSV